MFDNPVFVVILLVVVAALGAAAGFFAGRAKGQEMARDAKTADLNEAKAQIEADRQEISELSTSVTQYRTQAEGLAQQLTYLKSQLAQAQRAEQERVERERERAAAEAERKQAENERKLQEQSKVLSALAPVQKNLDALQQKVSQIEEGRKREMGALGEQLKGLGEQQARLDRETNALSSALRNNKVRGAWGEAQLRNIVESAGLLEHVDFDTQVVLTTGSTLPILLLCSWPIRWNGICSPAIVEAPASSATPNANPRSPQRAINPSAFAITSCGRFSPIIRTPASIAAMISPTSRVFVAASRRTEPASRPACCSADAMRSSTRCTPSAICTARTPSITSLARFLWSIYAVMFSLLRSIPTTSTRVRRSPYDGLK